MQKMLLLVALLAIASVQASPGEDENGHGGHHDDTADGHGDAHGHGAGVASPEMMTNDTWSHTFDEAGQFEYHCHPHPWMQASIEVLESNGTTMNHTINIIEPENWENWTFDPTELTIRAGDTVTWVNVGGQMHKLAQTTEEHAEHIAGAGSTVEPHDADHEHSEASPWKPVLLIAGAVGIGLVIAQSRRKSD